MPLLQDHACSNNPTTENSHMDQPVWAIKTVTISVPDKDDDAREYAESTLKPALERAGFTALIVSASASDSSSADWIKTHQPAIQSSTVVPIISQQYLADATCRRVLDLALADEPNLPKDAGYSWNRVIPVFYKPDPDQLISSCDEEIKHCSEEAVGLWLAQLAQQLKGWSSSRSSGQALPDLAVLPPGDASSAANAARHVVRRAAEWQWAEWPRPIRPIRPYSPLVAEVAAAVAVPYQDSIGVALPAEGSGNRVLKEVHRRLSAELDVQATPPASTTNSALQKFTHSALVDLQPASDPSKGMSTREALCSILEQLTAGYVSSLRPTSWLQARLTELMQDNAVLLVLLNVPSEEMCMDLLSVFTSGLSRPGSSVCITTTQSKESAEIESWSQCDPHQFMYISNDSTLRGILPVVPSKLKLHEIKVCNQQNESEEELEDLRSEGLPELLMSLPATSKDVLFDIVSVLRGQPYDAVQMPAVIADLTPYISRDSQDMLQVDDVLVKEVADILCSPEKAAQYGQTLGSRVWLQPDGQLPTALQHAVKVDKVQVRAARVDAATAAQLISNKQLSEACILIITPSNTDPQLPVPGSAEWPAEQLQSGELQPVLQHLQYLDLGCGVADLAPWLEHAPNLLVLRATQARRGWQEAVSSWLFRSSNLAVLPDSIGALSALQYLDLYSCSHLQALPDAIIQLPELQELHIRDCCSLQALPADLGLMQSLTVLDLSGCSSLSALPAAIGRLGSILKQLNLRRCKNLSKLPPTVWDLTGIVDYGPPCSGGAELPDPPPVVYKLKPVFNTKERYTVLSIDGGGMRGLIPARVLEKVERLLQEEAWRILRQADTPVRQAFLKRFPDMNKVTDEKQIGVDLADFFDVISGTSTGSILASYLATKGGYTAENILRSDEYRTGVNEFCQHTNQEVQHLLPGSARAAQAMFVATRQTIFPPRARFNLNGWYGCLHPKEGIVKVLQQSFGRDLAAIRLSDCAAADPGNHRPALHTSLLVPTFHLESNHAVLFWHSNLAQGAVSAHASSSGASRQQLQDPQLQHAWGFSTINRLRPPKWLLKSLKREGSRQVLHVMFPGRDLLPARLVFETRGDTVHVYSEPSDVAGNAGQSDIDGVASRDTSPASSGPDQHHVDRAAEAAAVTPAEVLDFNLWEVVRASTAAPTYFPAHEMAIRGPTFKRSEQTAEAQPGDCWPILATDVGGKCHFVDGGVVANNPTIAGISFLQRIYPSSDATNTAVLSLGCGSCWNSSGLPPAGGKAAVAAPLIDIMLGANCDTAVAAGEMMFRTARRNLHKGRARSHPKSTDSQETEAQLTGNQPDSFLRVQGVAFKSAASITPPTDSDASSSSSSSSRGGSDSGNGGDGSGLSSWCSYYTISDNQHVEAVGRMDEPQDWQALLEIGAGLAAHFEEDIRKWVRHYLLCIPDAGGTSSTLPGTNLQRQVRSQVYIDPVPQTRSPAMSRAWLARRAAQEPRV